MGFFNEAHSMSFDAVESFVGRTQRWDLWSRNLVDRHDTKMVLSSRIPTIKTRSKLTVRESSFNEHLKREQRRRNDEWLNECKELELQAEQGGQA